MNSIRTLRLTIAGLLVALLLSLYFNPFGSNMTTTKNICMDYDNVNMNTLDADLIHLMSNEYKNNQLNYIQSKNGTIAPTDANAIWFDLVTLKKFLYHIESKSKIEDNKLGIRFYYATYPDVNAMKNYRDLQDANGNLLFPNYEGLHTLVMIPTITIDGKIVDFNPLDESTYGKGLAADPKYSDHDGTNIPNNQTAALSGTVMRDISGQNHGTLSPPDLLFGKGF